MTKPIQLTPEVGMFIRIGKSTLIDPECVGIVLQIISLPLDATSDPYTETKVIDPGHSRFEKQQVVYHLIKEVDHLFYPSSNEEYIIFLNKKEGLNG